MFWISMATGFERHSSFKRSSPPARWNIYTQRHTHKIRHGEGRRLRVFDLNAKDDWVYLSVDLYKATWRTYEEEEEGKLWRKLPTVGSPTEAPDSCCALHHSHNPSVLFNSRLLSVIIHRSGFVVLFLSPLISFCTHSGIQEHIHTLSLSHTHTLKEEMRTSRGIGAGVSRWKEANLWLDDWVIEKVKGQSCKAVSLSTSLTQTRTNAETQERQPDPELETLELASSFKRTVLIINSMVFMRWRWQKDKESWLINHIFVIIGIWKCTTNASEICLKCDE